ncbi:hypothetical protein [Sphingobium abikonense]|uniref:hypothetical protein n=1 Tax=Sphingobium abikonense TaxID=86193 RepID=UPI003511605E
MSDWELIDQYQGTRTYLGGGDDADTVLVKREFDPAYTTAILERNKAMQNEDFDRKGEMWHAASIPVSIMFEWLTKHGVSVWNPAHGDAVKKLLNSDEYRYLRVRNFII